MKTIVFLTEQPLNNWNYERFGIDIFLDNNFLVEYWYGEKEKFQKVKYTIKKLNSFIVKVSQKLKTI